MVSEGTPALQPVTPGSRPLKITSLSGILPIVGMSRLPIVRMGVPGL